MRRCVSLFAGSLLVLSTNQLAVGSTPGRETVLVTRLSGDGFSVEVTLTGVRVRASSLDGHGLYEGVDLIVANREVTADNAEELSEYGSHVLRYDGSAETDHEFALAEGEFRRSLLVISYNIGNQGGLETVREFVIPTACLKAGFREDSPPAPPQPSKLRECAALSSAHREFERLTGISEQRLYADFSSESWFYGSVDDPANGGRLTADEKERARRIVGGKPFFLHRFSPVKFRSDPVEIVVSEDGRSILGCLKNPFPPRRQPRK